MMLEEIVQAVCGNTYQACSRLLDNGFDFRVERFDQWRKAKERAEPGFVALVDGRAGRSTAAALVTRFGVPDTVL